MPDDVDVLKLVCGKLHDANIPYMLTGSLAANLYAVPRMTRDIDFVIEILRFEIDKFSRAFEKEFYLEKGSILEAIQYESMFNIIHHNSSYKVDFIIRKNQAYREVEFQRRCQIKLNETVVWIVSPEDLIISKLFWAKDSNSEMQIKDVRNLIATIKNLDMRYILKWVQSLELDSIYKKVLGNG